ncbi:hypothetical protein PMIN02_002561 [Paraphaeosphaeria minitans]
MMEVPGGCRVNAASRASVFPTFLGRVDFAGIGRTLWVPGSKARRYVHDYRPRKAKGRTTAGEARRTCDSAGPSCFLLDRVREGLARLIDMLMDGQKQVGRKQAALFIQRGWRWPCSETLSSPLAWVARPPVPSSLRTVSPDTSQLVKLDPLHDVGSAKEMVPTSDVTGRRQLH